MSSNKPDVEFKKPMQPRISIANRDKPLFASRRPPPRPQQRTDFFTDSLNTSYIPSPSPTRATTRAGVIAKPRSANLKGSTSSSARKTTRELKGGDKSFSHTPSPRRGTKQEKQSSREPRIEQTSTRGYSSPVGVKQPTPRTAAKTPSPHRERQVETLVSPASEASASSPPRGLAEAYQRIQDEELLAGHEDESLDESDFTDEHLDGGTSDIQGDQQHGTRQPPSPTPKESARRTSMKDSREDMAIVRDHDDGSVTGDYTQNSDSTSSLSLQANQREDTFDRVLSQHDKDEQRLRGVLQSDLQPFKKSRIKEKTGLTVDNLRRQDASSRSGSSTLGSPSISSKGSDPSLNIPQGWGRKGRGSNTWLSRISQGSGKFTGDVSVSRHLQPQQISEAKASSSPVVDWLAAAAEVPLPTVEGESSQTRSVSRGSTPLGNIRSSQLHRQNSSDRLRRWEFLDDDFTARSLQVSDSPPIRIRNAALDAIREREIQTLEKSAVTTNRLDELREKRSLEKVRRRSTSVSTEKGLDARNESDVLERVRSSSSRKSLSRVSAKEEEPNVLLEEPLFEGENGEPTPNSPVVITRINPRSTTSIDESRSSVRPYVERLDSRDLLRKLARATSASPTQSPIGSLEGKKDVDANKSAPGSDEDNARVLNLPPMMMSSQIDGSDPDESPATAADVAEVSSHARPPVHHTPQQSKPNVYLKTPLVTGAWIETPLPTGGRGVLMPTPNELEDESELALGIDASIVKSAAEKMVKESISTAKSGKSQGPSLADTAPLLPKSALAAIIDRAKSNRKKFEDEPGEIDDTLLLDDSTIQSLEGLLATDTDSPALPTPPRSPAASHQTPSHSSPATTTSQDQEAQSYSHLTSRLSRLGLSLRDAKNGLASLERTVSAVPSAPSSPLPPLSGECVEAGEIHDFIWPCERCGCRGRAPSDPPTWQTLHIALPRLWTWRADDRLPRLTWLGAATLLGWALLLAEWIAHRAYSPPFFAESMVGYGVDCHAPRPPFVLAQLLWRSPLGLPVRVLWFGARVLARLGARVLGVSEGVWGWDRSGGGERGPWRYREVRAPPRGSWGSGAGWEDGGLMAGDEYL